MGALSGESDAQYAMRQTRLRNEAKARMAAKFGGGGLSGVGSGAAAPAAAPSSGGFGGAPASTLREALPGPGQDPNGMEALSGESDEQYVLRQTRLRNEAKARMAAKFGGGGMGGVGSGAAAPRAAPSSGGFGGMGGSVPSSGNSMGVTLTTPKQPVAKVTSGGDFFANFGS
jgi:hypothetical protein